MVGGGQSSRAVLHLPPSEAHQCDFARYVYLKHSTSKPVDIPFFLEKLGWTHSTKETNVLERVAKLQSGGSLTRSSRSAVVPKPSLAPSPSTSGPSSRLAQNPQTGESSAKRRRLNTTPSLAFVETPNTVIHVDSDEEDEWVEAPQAHNAVPPVSEKPTTSYLSKSEQEEYRKLVSDGGYTNWPEWVRRVTAHGILSSLRPKCWNDIAFRIQRKKNIRTLTPDVSFCTNFTSGPARQLTYDIRLDRESKSAGTRSSCRSCSQIIANLCHGLQKTCGIGTLFIFCGTCPAQCLTRILSGQMSRTIFRHSLQLGEPARLK